MLDEYVRVPVTESVQVRRRPLDVREEESDFRTGDRALLNDGGGPATLPRRAAQAWTRQTTSGLAARRLPLVDPLNAGNVSSLRRSESGGELCAWN